MTATTAELNQLAGQTAYTRSNILGTVSQSAGVPTGAIIERGSNANGEFVKYADGTMVCWTRRTLVDHTGVLASSTRLTGVFTYPATFIDFSSLAISINVPVHASANFVGCNRLNIISWGTGFEDVSSSDVSVFFTSGVSTTDARIENMQATAIGRWF